MNVIDSPQIGTAKKVTLRVFTISRSGMNPGVNNIPDMIIAQSAVARLWFHDMVRESGSDGRDDG
jgi:hypothetical protein